MKKYYIHPETTTYVVTGNPYCINNYSEKGDPGEDNEYSKGSGDWEDEDDDI